MRLLRLVLICAIFTVPGVASTLNLSEGSDYPGGDFPASGYPLLGSLGVGANTISGWIYGYNVQDIDTFSVAPVAGTEVVSEEIDFTGTSNGKNISITEPIDGTTNITGNVDLTLTPASPITGVIDVETQGIADTAICTGPGNTPPCTYIPVQYAITYTVQDIPAPAPAPEPSSLILMGTGLLALTGKLKRHLAA